MPIFDRIAIAEMFSQNSLVNKRNGAECQHIRLVLNISVTVTKYQ